MTTPSYISQLTSHNQVKNGKSPDLNIRTYQFSLEIVRLINELPNKKAFWAISDQLIRSATSIGANIIEAKAGSSRKDFLKFYEIALKSANETVYWLALLRDSSPEFKAKAERLIEETCEISRMLTASILTLKRNSSPH